MKDLKKDFLKYSKEFFQKGDMVLLTVSLICTVFGLVLIASATANRPGRTFIPVQLIGIFIGIGLYVLFTFLDVDIIADKWGLLLIFETLFLLILIPFGVAGDTGNQGWIRFGGIGIQPSEVVKVVFIVVMAKQMAYLKEYKDISSVSSVFMMAFHFLYIFALIMITSSDLGSAVVFMGIFAVMILVVGVKIWWFFVAIALVAVASPLLWTKFLDEYQRLRILAPYDPSVDPEGYGIRWQTIRAKLAIAAGQFKGVGLGKGPQTQSLSLTGSHTDFIFSVAGEELGMAACLVIMALLLILVIRCVYVGLHCNNTMGMLICFGVAASLFFQMLINTGMNIGITPVIGITLPFFSYGGSSVMSTYAAIGLVSGIKYRPRPERYRRLTTSKSSR